MLYLRIIAIVLGLAMTVGPGACGAWAFVGGMAGVLAHPPQQWAGLIAIIGILFIGVAGLSAWAVVYQVRKLREERGD